MSEQNSLQKPVGIVEQGLILFLWLIQVMALFFPWENYLNPQSDAPGAPIGQAGTAASGVSRAIILLSYALVFGLSLVRWKQVLRTLRVAWPIVILCLWVMLSALRGPDPAKSGVARFLMVVLFSVYVASRLDSKQLIGLLTKGFAAAVLASVAVMLVAPKYGIGAIAGEYANSWRGAFTHKNWLGAAMSLGIIVSGYSYYSRANHRLVSAATLLGCLALLVLSRSATGLISTCLSLLVAIIGAFIQSKRAPALRVFAFIGIGIAAIILLLLPLGVFDIGVKDITSFAGRSSTLTGRTDLWRAVWSAVRERMLLGYGYGFWEQPSVTRSNIWIAANWQAPHAHNDWLDMSLQLGFVGVFIIAGIWLTALRRAIWLVLVQYGHGALLFLVIVVNCLSRSATETVMLAPVLLTLFWMVISYIYLARIAEQRQAEARTRHAESEATAALSPVSA